MSLEPVASVLVKDRDAPRPERRARDWEGFRGSKTGIVPGDVKAEVTALWNQSDSGAAFRAALAERGYLLCKGDRRDFCIIDPEATISVSRDASTGPKRATFAKLSRI